MKSSIFGFREWASDAPQYLRADFLAGLTLWAMIVPEAVAYASLAGAPTPAAGLYGIIIVLPIYALFASSRFLVATSTAAISVTFASFLALMSTQDAGSFAALIIAASIVFLIFYFFRLGFIVDFISEPVSRGFMLGLAIFIVIGQVPKILGVEKSEGNSIEQLIGLIQQLPDANWAAFAVAVFVILVMTLSKRISPKIPGALLALVMVIGIFYVTGAGAKFDLDMVPELPKGLPQFVLPTFSFADIAVMVPAGLGLVLVATSESAVLAQSLANKYNQKFDVNQQFLAFGVSNFVGAFFGGLIGAGSTSSTMVNHEAGAKTLMSTIWASIATLITALYLTGLFVYLPEAFLGTLIIHAVYHMLSFRKILDVRKYSKAEFNVAAIVLLAVLLFDVLNGLLIGMIFNLFYMGYKSARTHIEEFGYLTYDPLSLAPLRMDNVVAPPKDTLAFGLTKGQMYYASARSTLTQIQALMEAHPNAQNIVASVARMDDMDFTMKETVINVQEMARRAGKKLFITNIRSPRLLEEIKTLKLDPNVVDVSLGLDISNLSEHKIHGSDVSKEIVQKAAENALKKKNKPASGTQKPKNNSAKGK